MWLWQSYNKTDKSTAGSQKLRKGSVVGYTWDIQQDKGSRKSTLFDIMAIK